ncbi:MAG TPA: hypothetical protein VNG71_11260 [Pyrinomonadaceae bacterium]|nr:hypothetical protein [Pyrinomonadaceae bacterium]
MKRSVTRATLIGLFVALCAWSASAQTKVYRGSIGNSHIQMRLTFAGNEVSGTYAYDSVGQDLNLTGRLTNGALELTEMSGKQKTGKFVCKKPLSDSIDSECTWSKMDGSRESMATLEEQHFAFANGLQLTPKTIVNRRTGVSVSYPQITGSGTLSAGAQAFNRRIVTLAQKKIGEFAPIDGKGVFDTNYNVLFGTNDLVSVEMSEYYDGGGAHPNNSFWSLTYDLKGNKELKFEDLFKPDGDYNSAIAKYVVADIDKRARAVEEEDARQSGRKPEPREGPLVDLDQLNEVSGWGVTPAGLVVYFDFPHVIAFFDKTTVPYSVIQPFLKTDGPVAKALSQH